MHLKLYILKPFSGKEFLIPLVAESGKITVAKYKLNKMAFDGSNRVVYKLDKRSIRYGVICSC